MLVQIPSFSKSFVSATIGATLLLLMAMGFLIACGDSSTSTSTGSSNGSNSTPRQGGRNRANDSGTIDKYDATAKTLTIRTTSGTTMTFTTTNAQIVKSEKITTQDLSSLLGTSGVRVSITGQQGSDGTYTAQNLTVSDMTVMGNNGTPPAGGMQGTPPAGMNGTPPANGTRGANGMHRIMLQNAKLQNNQLIGTDQAGKSVTVKLSSSTLMFKETSGTADDLKAGQNVLVTTARTKDGNTGTEEARMIIVGDLPQQPGAAS